MERDLPQLHPGEPVSLIDLLGQIYRTHSGAIDEASKQPAAWTIKTSLDHLRAMLRVLEKLRVGVLLLDGRGRICHANRSAEALLHDRDGLYVDFGDAAAGGNGDDHTGGLRAATDEESAALRQLIAECGKEAAGNDADGDLNDNAIALSRPSGRRPLEILVSPITLERETGLAARRSFALERESTTPAVVAFVFDPGADPDLDGPAPAWTLMRLYALTPAEARVALEVAQGRGLQQAAAALGVSPNTVRTHLQHVFQKTGTRRQAELAQLLSRGPMQLRLD